MKFAALLFFALFATSTYALGPVLFGPEFTFDIFGRQESRSRKALIGRMRKHLIHGQVNGARFTETKLARKRIRFTSPNGWSFVVSTDPGVMELQMPPSTVDFYRHYQRDMQDAIFASASNVNMFPAEFRGGGHINLSMSTFDGNPLLLRNFLVDLYNHNELFLGAFGYDTHNSLSYSLFIEERKLQIKHFLETVDLDDVSVSDLPILVARIQQNVKDRFLVQWRPDSAPRIKGFAVNFNHVDQTPFSRIEIRAVRPQASMDMWVRQIALLEARIKYLETLTERIPFQERVPLQELDLVVARHDINPPIDPQEALRSFYAYVTESGQRWQAHSDYLWPDWIRNGEVKKFEESEWFLEQENRRCETKLAVGG